ncbi:hypothetical protein U3516DRAFT_617511 [Neocallimastix sp. 'constans']|jgi:hypothetical protein
MSNKKENDEDDIDIKYIIAACCAFPVVLTIIIICISYSMSSSKERIVNAKSKYRCDYVNFSLNTKIKVYSVIPNEELFYKIEGNILRSVTDPLTLYDERQNHKEIMYADDKYHYFTQDSHIIKSKISNEILCEMEGKYKKTYNGDSYDLYANNTMVGIAKFNKKNDYGDVETTSGDLIAEFSRDYLTKDYTVQINENNIFTDEVLLMIFASYVSDYSYDDSINKKNN